MKTLTFRTAGHGLAGAPVNARTIAAARMAHTLAQRTGPGTRAEQDRAPGAFSYMDAANAAPKLGDGGGTIKNLVKAFTIALTFE